MPAYLFIQWLNSEDISIQRVQLPYALRDPFRDSHYTNRPSTRAAGRRRPSIWRPCRPARSAACSTCRSSRPTSTRRPCARASPSSGPARIPRRSSTTSPRSGTRSPQRIGVDKQRAAYEAWAKKPNAYPIGFVSQGTAPALAGGRLSQSGGSPVQVSGDHARGPDHPADRAVPDRLFGCGQLSEHQHAGGGHLVQRAAELPAAAHRRPLLAGAAATPSSSLAVALPVELILGLLLAYLFLDRMPGRQVFVALLVLPVVISPIVAGAMWSILFDNRFGPINQILGWIAGQRDDDPVDRQSGLRLPGDPRRRDLAVDAVHVPAAAGGPFQRRQVAARGGRDRRRRLLASPSARSSCRRSGRCSPSPS